MGKSKGWPCVKPLEERNPSFEKDDKVREKGTNGEMTRGKEETSHLTCWTKSGGERENWREKERERRKEKKGEEERSETLQLIYGFHGDRAVGSRRSKRQSWFTQ